MFHIYIYVADICVANRKRKKPLTMLSLIYFDNSTRPPLHDAFYSCINRHHEKAFIKIYLENYTQGYNLQRNNNFRKLAPEILIAPFFFKLSVVKKKDS